MKKFRFVCVVAFCVCFFVPEYVRADKSVEPKSDEEAILAEIFEGGYEAEEQKVARAVDVLLTEGWLSAYIDAKQEKQSAPRLDEIRDRIIGATIEFDGNTHIVKPAKTFTWRDGHFLDDYSYQTSTEVRAALVKQYQRALIKFLRNVGALGVNSKLAGKDIERLRALKTSLGIRGSCEVIRRLGRP